MSVPQLIDSHCHLDFEAFDADRNEVLQRAAASHISDIIIPGTEKTLWDRIRLLCTNNSALHACYGLHPYWLHRHKKSDIDALGAYVEHHHPVALGECGLDFRPGQADKATQLYFFEAQLAMAASHRLPLVIHSVRATEAVLQSIRKFSNLSGMIHSYSGSLEQAKQLIELNFSISVSASITYERAQKIKNVVKAIPLRSILLETDAPDQPDSQHINNRNEPAYLVNTLRAVAAIRNESQDEVASQTSTNARTLFNIEQKPA